jgi:hypothetical protein
MAKRKKQGGGDKVADAAQPTRKQVDAARHVTSEPEVSGYAARFIDLELTTSEAVRLKHYLMRFQDEGAALESGKPLQTAEDCIRYIIQNSTVGGDAAK